MAQGGKKKKESIVVVLRVCSIVDSVPIPTTGGIVISGDEVTDWVVQSVDFPQVPTPEMCDRGEGLPSSVHDPAAWYTTGQHL